LSSPRTRHLRISVGASESSTWVYGEAFFNTLLELSKKLKELGVQQESLYRHVAFLDYGNSQKIYSPSGWYIAVWYKDRMFDRPRVDEEWVSAFTVAELGEMLPSLNGKGWIQSYKGDGGFWNVSFQVSTSNELVNFGSESEADARAKMLIYLLENGLLKD
jgi:hypothetical protein